MFQRTGADKNPNTFNIQGFPPPKIVPFMRKCGKSVVETDRPQMTI